jgi:hypothetical protein
LPRWTSRVRTPSPALSNAQFLLGFFFFGGMVD